MKECFGDFLGKSCHRNKNGCDLESECRPHTNERKGACDCPFKRSCHIPRQHERTFIAVEPIEKCSFYGYFMEDEALTQ